MPNAADIADSLTKATGLDAGTVRTVIRRLGDARLIPRSTRGKGAASLNEVEAARILVGLMVAADHFDGTAARIIDLVPVIGSLSVGDLSVYKRDDDLHVAAGGGFLGELAFAIEHNPDTVEIGGRLTVTAAYGVTFGGGAVCGWLEAHEVERLADGGLRSTGQVVRRYFGDRDTVKTGGLLRHIEIPRRVVVEVHRLFADDLRLPLPEKEGAAEAAPNSMSDLTALASGESAKLHTERYKSPDTISQAESDQARSISTKRNRPDERYRPPDPAHVAAA